jgi:hypothetical protein
VAAHVQRQACPRSAAQRTWLFAKLGRLFDVRCADGRVPSCFLQKVSCTGIVQYCSTADTPEEVAWRHPSRGGAKPHAAVAPARRARPRGAARGTSARRASRGANARVPCARARQLLPRVTPRQQRYCLNVKKWTQWTVRLSAPVKNLLRRLVTRAEVAPPPMGDAPTADWTAKAGTDAAPAAASSGAAAASGAVGATQVAPPASHAAAPAPALMPPPLAVQLAAWTEGTSALSPLDGAGGVGGGWPSGAATAPAHVDAPPPPALAAAAGADGGADGFRCLDRSHASTCTRCVARCCAARGARRRTQHLGPRAARECNHLRKSRRRRRCLPPPLPSEYEWCAAAAARCAAGGVRAPRRGARARGAARIAQWDSRARTVM